jgi:hypothetical protein
MSQDDFNQLKTKIALPAILCLAAVLIERSCFLILSLGHHNGVFNLVLLAMGVIAAGVALVAAKPRLYYYTVVIATSLYCMLEAAQLVHPLSTGPDSLWRLLSLAFSYPFLLAVFLVIRYRKAFLANRPADTDLLPLLGIALLGGALLTIVKFTLVGISYFAILFPMFLQAAVGIALLARDKGIGLIGSLAWIGFILYNRSFLMEKSVVATFVHLIGVTMFAVTAFIVLTRLLKTGFSRNTLSYFTSAANSSSSTTSKNCGKCGRSVSTSAAAGQCCPHCGAYWGREDTHYLSR